MRGLKKKHNFCDMLSRDYNALYDFLILLIITQGRPGFLCIRYSGAF